MIKNYNSKRFAIFFLLLGTASSFLLGADTKDSSISLFLIATGLFGGMGMFLYGMEMMSDGMKMTAGNSMRNILEKLTSNKFLAVTVGALVTMVIQSSSATTVMLVSFVNSGLINFSQALGVILGSNIGSTVTAQIVAFKVTDYALLLIASGSIMALFSKKDNIKNIGFVILGFGLLFYGMKIMSDTMKPLRSDPTFNAILTSFENPLLGILAGAVFTALVQSSSATTGIVITLASGGSITLEAGIPLIFGANIGTCVTALLAGLNASRDAKRVAIGHVTFNVLGVVLFCFWIPTFAEFVSQTSDNIPRQIANAHTIFNIMATVVFIPFTSYISKVIIQYFPDEVIDRDINKPAILHLDESALDEPTLAINNANAEIRGVVGLMERVVGSMVKPFIEGADQKDVEDSSVDFQDGMDQRIEKISFLNESISDYLLKTSRSELSEDQTKEVYSLVSCTNYLDSMNNIVKTRFGAMLKNLNKDSKALSNDSQNEVLLYHKKMIKQLKRLNKFFEKFDRTKAEKIVQKMAKNKDLEEKYKLKVSQKTKKAKGTKDDDKLYTDLMEMLKQLNIFIELIASSLLTLEEKSQA